MELSLLTLLFFFVLAIAALGLFARSRAQEGISISSGISSNKPFGWYSLAGSFVATQVGGSSLLYTAECAYTDGIYAILYPLGSVLGLLALGLGVGAKIQRLQIKSVPELFEKHYRSHTLKKISCYLSMASIVGLLAAQAVALKDFFQAVGFQHDILFILAWIAIVLVTFRGAIKTRAWTDIMLALFFLVVLAAACFFSPQSPTQAVSFLGPFNGIQAELLEGYNTKLSAYLLMPCLFMFLEPEMIQSTLRVQSKRGISAAVIFSGVVLLLCSLIPVYYGIAGKACGIAESSSGFMSTVDKATNPWIATCSACVLLFALVSGAASLIQSLNTHLIKDLIYKKAPGTTKAISWSCTLALGMIALWFSYSNLGIAALILESYELVVVCMLVPLVQAAFSQQDREFPKLAAWLSMLFGASGFFACRVLPISFFPEVFSILLSWLGFILGKRLANEEWFWIKKVECRDKNGQNVDCVRLGCSQ